MTLVVGLKTNDCIVIGAEQEESGGVTSKRTVSKLKLITGHDWAVVVGAAGDAYLGDKAMQRMKRDLEGYKHLTEEILTDVTDKILDSIYTKYVDKDPKSEGIALVIGASCGDQLHLISTSKRVPQEQDSMAYAGYGGDIGIFFMDRLYRRDASWEYTATVAGFTLQQAVEACQYCGGESEIYILQRRPYARWRSLGNADIPTEFQSNFQKGEVSDALVAFVERKTFHMEGSWGYSDEFNHEPMKSRDLSALFFPLEFFPSRWLRSTPYQKQVEEICSRNRDTLLQSGFVKMCQQTALKAQIQGQAVHQQEANGQKEKPRSPDT